jgi:hypothetical protein
MANTNLPASWNNAENVAFADYDNKDDFVGVPLLITGATFVAKEKENNSIIRSVIVEAETADGILIEFTDSSQGIHVQLREHVMNSKGIAEADDLYQTGQVYETRIVAPMGLRKSTYEVQVQGKTRQASTFYLTGARRRDKAVTEAQSARTARRNKPTA